VHDAARSCDGPLSDRVSPASRGRLPCQNPRCCLRLPSTACCTRCKLWMPSVVRMPRRRPRKRALCPAKAILWIVLRPHRPGQLRLLPTMAHSTCSTCSHSWQRGLWGTISCTLFVGGSVGCVGMVAMLTVLAWWQECVALLLRLLHHFAVGLSRKFHAFGSIAGLVPEQLARLSIDLLSSTCDSSFESKTRAEGMPTCSKERGASNTDIHCPR